MASDVSTWVNDQLHSLMGMSERTIVDYILALARKEATAAGLVRKLVGVGLEDGARTRQFALELLRRIHGAAGAGGAVVRPAVSEEAQRRREAIALRRKNERYELLEDDDDADEQEAPLAITPQPQRVVTERRKHRIAAGEDEAAERQLPVTGGTATSSVLGQVASGPAANDTPREAGPGTSAAIAVGTLRGGEAHSDDYSDDGDDHNHGLDDAGRDAAERDAFAERLRQRDMDKTRNLVIGGDVAASDTKRKMELELASADAETRAQALTDLRKVSRRRYLTDREQKILEATRGDIEDEERLFAGEKLTKREREEIDFKRKVFGLAQQRASVAKADTEERYRMPDAYDGEGASAEDRARRQDLLHARYEPEAKAEPSEQQQWEDQQVGKALAKVGAREGRKRIDDEAATLALEDHIAFVTDEVIAGYLDVPSSRGAGEEEKHAHPPAPTPLTSSQAIAKERASLPIFPYRDELLQAVRDHQVVIIVGETGSGKTTQIVQYLHEAGYTGGGLKVGCTQPRRVAAMSVAKRVADEVGCKLGHEVGYAIRFEDCTSDRTVMKYMTDGMLLREFLSVPDLADYSVIMLDEAHERTLHTDVAFALLKDVCRFRPDDFKLLVSSATLDAAKFSDYFDGAPTFNIPGRRYPVDILYTKQPEADYLEASVVTVLQVHITQRLPGDVLVFYTGQEEIEAAMETLQQRTRGFGTKLAEMRVLPIYANLPSDMQARIFEPTPSGARKVVLATNIAETSLTIDGIVYVIDPGFVKMNSYNPRSGVESLIVTPCARSQANQRAGRAGRVAPGKCFRLYTKWAFEHEMEDNVVPEIQRTNLGNVVLLLKSLGIHDLLHFDFMDPPPSETLIRALEQLYALGALNDRGELTKLGRQMAEFPLDPQMAKTLLAAGKYGVADRALGVCAMLSIGNAVFYRPKDRAVHADNARIAFNKPLGDHPTLLHVYGAWRDTNFSSQWCTDNFIQVRSMRKARDVYEQLEQLCERAEVDLESRPPAAADPDVLLCKAVLAGYFYHTAKLQANGEYRTVKNPQTIHTHPSSALAKDPPRWVVYHELVFTSKEFMRTVSQVQPEWLVEIAPHYYQAKDLEDVAAKKLSKKVGLSSAAAAAGGAFDGAKSINMATLT